MSETGTEKIVEAPDVDAMSDKEVADLKNTMRDSPAEDAVETVEKKEPEKAAKPEEKSEEEKQEFVPHGQFHRERERRKEAERLSSVATQRLAELLEASRPQQQRPQDPDPQPDDPLERIDWQARRLQRLEGHIVETHQQTQREQAERQVLNLVDAHFAQKAAERPELNDIGDFVVQSYGREFAALQGLAGISSDGKIIPNSPVAEAVRRHIKQIAIHCYNNNIPIEAYYEGLAKARGWQASQAQPNGAAAPRNPDGTFAKQEADKIDAIEATKRKAKSLGGTGAPVEMSEITPDALINMSNEDFAAFKKKHGENAMRKAFGAMH